MIFAADGHAIFPGQPQVKPLPEGALQAAPLELTAEGNDTVRSAGLQQSGHSMLSKGWRWIFSISLSQLTQWYSKMGIVVTSFDLFIHIFIYYFLGNGKLKNNISSPGLFQTPFGLFAKIEPNLDQKNRQESQRAVSIDHLQKKAPKESSSGAFSD
jgi:hypothetical protein